MLSKREQSVIRVIWEVYPQQKNDSEELAVDDFVIIFTLLFMYDSCIFRVRKDAKLCLKVSGNGIYSLLKKSLNIFLCRKTTVRYSFVNWGLIISRKMYYGVCFSIWVPVMSRIAKPNLGVLWLGGDGFSVSESIKKWEEFRQVLIPSCVFKSDCRQQSFWDRTRIELA